jgi:hypothetical protein
MKIIAFILPAIYLVLAGCTEMGTTAQATSSSTSAQQASFMTQSELLATIPGATLYGISSNDGATPWVQAYSSGGKKGIISGLWNEDPYQARWYVKDDMWCETGNEYDTCWSVVKVSDKQLQAYKEGGEKTKNPWNIR